MPCRPEGHRATPAHGPCTTHTRKKRRAPPATADLGARTEPVDMRNDPLSMPKHKALDLQVSRAWSGSSAAEEALTQMRDVPVLRFV